MGLIRLFLALSVVVWHIPTRPFTLMNAQIAVLFFFITSGFYMALTINEVYAPRGAERAAGWRRAFYLSRILRLYPAYLATMSGMVLWFGITHTANVFLNHPNVPLPAFIGLVLMNVFIVGQDFYQTIINSVNLEETNSITQTVTNTLPAHLFQNIWMLVGQAWSLGSELLFYAMAPFIVQSVTRLATVLSISLAIRWAFIFGLHGFASTIWGYNFFPATCCMFCMGSLCYHLYPRLRRYHISGTIGCAISSVFGVFALVSMVFLHTILPVGPTGLDTLPLWCAYIIYALSLPFVFLFWRKNKIDRWIGELSYPLYLVHGAIIGLIFADVKADQTAKEFFAIFTSLSVATLVFMLIDRPVDAWRHRHFGRPQLTERKPLAIRREWLVLACVFVVIFTNTLRLYAFASPVTAPPILVATYKSFNIVAYNGRLIAVPEDDNITFGAPGYDKDKRLVIGTKLSEVKHQINILPKYPVLICAERNYNIVEYNDRYFGILQGQAIRWGAPGFDRDKQLIIGKHIEDVKTIIDNIPKPAQLVDVDGHYNIVDYDNRVFGVLQGLPINWGQPGYDSDKHLVIGHSIGEVRQLIANQPALLGVDGPYNIVRYNGKVFGILHTVPITWGQAGYEKTPSLIIADSVAEVKQRISAHSTITP